MDQAARILVVDDEAAIRHTLEVLLCRQGYEVCTAADSAEAHVWLRKGRFDLLILDLMFPRGTSGMELAQSAHAFQPDMAVLILTGSDAFVKIVGAASISCFTIMHKTASPRDVLDQVTLLLAHKRVPISPIH